MKTYTPMNYRVTNTLAEVNLQNLLHHTATQLSIYLKDVLDTLSANECSSLELISKWGCDGPQQTQFKQKFDNSTESNANIFQTSLVPLGLFCSTDTKHDIRVLFYYINKLDTVDQSKSLFLRSLWKLYIIDTQKFGKYTMHTAKLDIELYPWYLKTPTQNCMTWTYYSRKSLTANWAVIERSGRS